MKAEVDTNCWDELWPEDYKRLTQTPSLQFDPPCVWCHRRNRHHWMCVHQRGDWHKMPFGKHKGMRITEVPEDYLVFILQEGYGNPDDRQLLLDELQYRDRQYRTTEWDQIAEFQREPEYLPNELEGREHCGLSAPLPQRDHTVFLTDPSGSRVGSWVDQ